MRWYPREYKYSRRCTHACHLATKSGSTAEDALAGIRKLRKVIEAVGINELNESSLDSVLGQIRSRYFASVEVQLALLGLCELHPDSKEAFNVIGLLIIHPQEKVWQAAAETAQRFMDNFLERHHPSEAWKFLDVLSYLQRAHFSNERVLKVSIKLIGHISGYPSLCEWE